MVYWRNNLKCHNCNETTPHTGANFCSNCGESYPEIEKLPLVGVCRDTGIFRLKMTIPIERECLHIDDAKEELRRGQWDLDSYHECFKVEFVRSTVTTKTHPYECGTCRAEEEDMSAVMVSETKDGVCETCNKVNWILRKE